MSGFFAIAAVGCKPGQTAHATTKSSVSTGVCSMDSFASFLSILTPTKSRIQLSVEPAQPNYAVGDKVRFAVASPFAGKLVLMTVDAANNVFPVFPSRATGNAVNDKIEAGKPIVLPRPAAGYYFETAPPLGPSRLIAIVRPLDRDLPLECARGLTKGRPIRLIANDPSNKKGVLRTHDASSRGGATSRSTTGQNAMPAAFPGWGYAEVRYEVVPASAP